jgi:chromosome segregation protein
MTALLTRLRIAGFKSFAEPATVDILPGLTGIVGPNGCGKSNVVEALRWAMGETSARSLRGGEMDDVIFAGTAARPSRNLAEVTITLQKAGDTNLPDPFGADEELAVTRRIERGAGSAYRANGREMRARDVQTLYADLASGARSSGMVSQGRVAALVNAKPEERRMVLEEAAGITGLHARRHEAELKLRAAETNLTRSEELRAQLDAGRETLRKQAKQASRYRNINGLVRDAEVSLLAIQYARAAALLANAGGSQEAAERAVADAEAAVHAATIALEQAELGLATPRDAEAAARSLLERRRLEAETLAGEAARAEESLRAAEQLLADIDADLAHAQRQEQDAAEALTALRDEDAALADRLRALPEEIDSAAATVRAAEAARQGAATAAETAAAAAAEAAAAAKQAALAVSEAETRHKTATAALRLAEAAHADAQAALIAPDALAHAAAAITAASETLAETRATAEAAETARAAAVAAAAAAHAALDRATLQHRQAQTRQAEARAYAARIAAALTESRAALARAQHATVAAESLAEAAVQATAAAEAEAAGDTRAQDAEAAHHRAGAARLEAAQAHNTARSTRAAAEQARADATARANRLRQELHTLQAAQAQAESALIAPAQLTDSAARLESATQTHADTSATLAAATTTRDEAAAALNTAREAANATAATLSRLQAEADGLRAALSGQDDATILDCLDVPPGLEAAYAAAFAEAGGALDPTAAKFWRDLPPLEAAAPPPGCTPLPTGPIPSPLTRALSRVWLLADGADGDTLHTMLPAGGVLVSQAGAAWRWDGQVTTAGAPDAAAARLLQRNRLRTVLAALDAATAAAAQAATTFQDTTATATTAARAESDAKAALTAAETALASIRRDHAALQARESAARTRLDALTPSATRLAAELTDAETAATTAADRLSALPPQEALTAALADADAQARAADAALHQARAARDATRAAAARARAAHQTLQTQAAEAESRVAALAPQCDRLTTEAAGAEAALAEADTEAAALPPLQTLRDTATSGTAAAENALQTLTATRAALDQAAAKLRQLEADSARLSAAAAEAEHACAARRTLLEKALSDAAAAETALAAARASESALPDPWTQAQHAADCRDRAEAARQALSDANAQYAGLQATQRAAVSRLHAVQDSLRAWEARHAEAARQLDGLTTRRDAAQTARDAVATAPEELRQRAENSGTVLADAEADHLRAGETLRCAEKSLRAAGIHQRDADAQLAAAREALARCEGSAETAEATMANVLANTAERLGPDATLPEAEDITEAAEERARRKLERLSREREEMGPVNLCAETELEELDARIAGIDTQREELTTAIAKLRGSIGHLNREGRERLSAVFTEVDKHFRTLFTRMMGGGRAHLALTGSDDPLEAGLEIYAEPPGKKLATLSLLSGGEQALTALSLIFAVFRCTPAPVAVLDEVDAPLDDANVDRFCALLEDVVKDTGTRFLVVTHHQLTMSRMDRLYGVTMQERGVSRLLSVDLRRAAEMVEQPQLALQAAE